MLMGILAASAAGHAHAGDNTGSWYVTPSVQWWDLDEHRQAADHVAGQFALGYAYDAHWAVEIEAAGASFASYCGCALSLTAVSVDGIYKFGPGETLRPYLIAGIGVMHDRVDGSPSSTGPAAEAGLGLLSAPRALAGSVGWQFRSEIKYRREFSDKTATAASVGDVVAGLGLQFSFR
jgi:OOP family OmpA-OmpF porin